MAELPTEKAGVPELDDDNDVGPDAADTTSASIRAAFDAGQHSEARAAKTPTRPEVIPGGADT